VLSGWSIGLDAGGGRLRHIAGSRWGDRRNPKLEWLEQPFEPVVEVAKET